MNYYNVEDMCQRQRLRSLVQMLQNKHNLSVNKQNLFRQVVLVNVTAAESEEISFVFLHFISGKMFFISPYLTIYNNLGDKA